MTTIHETNTRRFCTLPAIHVGWGRCRNCRADQLLWDLGHSAMDALAVVDQMAAEFPGTVSQEVRNCFADDIQTLLQDFSAVLS